MLVFRLLMSHSHLFVFLSRPHPVNLRLHRQTSPHHAQVRSHENLISTDNIGNMLCERMRWTQAPAKEGPGLPCPARVVTVSSRRHDTERWAGSNLAGGGPTRRVPTHSAFAMVIANFRWHCRRWTWRLAYP